ncbi:MAG: hypothetical protein FWG18_03950 [Alphaproteobacteria bacterium]|nr:hypothetical protein [Alphaproteobacteria bacterium]
MKKFASACVLAIFTTFGASPVLADYPYHWFFRGLDYIKDNYILFADIDDGADALLHYDWMLVEVGAVVNYAKFDVAGSGVIENYGHVAGDFNIYNNITVVVKNFGQFSGEFILGENSHLVQIVTDYSDMHALNISNIRGSGSLFTILADGVSGVDFMDLVALAKDADRLILRDSLILFNLNYTTTVPIEISGNVVLLIENVSGLKSRAILPGVTGDGKLFVVTNAGTMFYAETEYIDGNVVLLVSRDTNYENIFGDTLGRFINNIRASGASPKLMAAMDAAQTIEELNAIMRNSIMFNPTNLMRPVKMMTMFEGIHFRPGVTGWSGAGGGNVVFGDDMLLYMAEFGAEYNASDFSFGASLHAGAFSESGLEDFAGKIYGGKLHAAMDRNIFYGSMYIGATYAMTDSGPIYNGAGGSVYNPDGVAYHGAANVGIRAFESGTLRKGMFFANPIARLRMFSAKVLNKSESEFAFGGGAIMGYGIAVSGVTTTYSAYGLVEQSARQFGVRTDIESLRDGVNIGLEVGVIDSDIGQFYKIGANITAGF